MTKSTFKWRAAYDETCELEGDRAATSCQDESLAVQAARDDCDLNILVKRFGIEKAPIPVEAFDPSYYGDFSDVPDLRTALELVRDAENRFRDLPSRIRERFDNQPAKLWHFVNDPENGEEAVRLGLLKRPAVPEGNETPPPEGGQGT